MNTNWLVNLFRHQRIQNIRPEIL